MFFHTYNSNIIVQLDGVVEHLNALLSKESNGGKNGVSIVVKDMQAHIANLWYSNAQTSLEKRVTPDDIWAMFEALHLTLLDSNVTRAPSEDGVAMVFTMLPKRFPRIELDLDSSTSSGKFIAPPIPRELVPAKTRKKMKVKRREV